MRFLPGKLFEFLVVPFKNLISLAIFIWFSIIYVRYIISSTNISFLLNIETNIREKVLSYFFNPFDRLLTIKKNLKFLLFSIAILIFFISGPIISAVPKWKCLFKGFDFKLELIWFCRSLASIYLCIMHNTIRNETETIHSKMVISDSDILRYGIWLFCSKI